MTSSLSEIIYAIVAITSGMVVYQVLFVFVRRWSHKKRKFIPQLLNKYIYYPGLVLMCNFTIWISLYFLEDHLSAHTDGLIRHALKISNIVFTGFFFKPCHYSIG